PPRSASRVSGRRDSRREVGRHSGFASKSAVADLDNEESGQRRIWTRKNGELGQAQVRCARPKTTGNLSHSPKSQMGGPAPFAFGLAAVARHGEAGPWQAPVVGTLGDPGKVRRAQQMRERPCGVIVDV